MNNKGLVSIIIPVYNAAKFVGEAVDSAIIQPEVLEVLLIEDGSPDNGLEVCQQLAENYPQVKLYQHPDGANLGPSASRNLGILNARGKYIAFLDADDYYLPNRFSTAVKILEEQPELDGVYEPVLATYEDQSAKDLFDQSSLAEFRMILHPPLPENLYQAFMLGEAANGFHLDGFTSRSALYPRTNIYFDTGMPISQDTLLIYQLSAKANLVAGERQNPVAMRRVHQSNRITHHLSDKRKAAYSRAKVLEKLLTWGKKNLTFEQFMLVVLRYIYALMVIQRTIQFSWRDFPFVWRKIIGTLVSNLPIFLSPKFWKILFEKKLAKKYLKKISQQ